MNGGSNGADRPLRWAVAVLTLTTAAIHLSLAFPDPVFILNGLGYLTLLAALLSPRAARYHRALRWALLAYAAVTILLWVVFGARTTVGYVDKAVEVALILTLILWMRRAPRGPGP